MSATVKIRDIVLGEGLPKICVPLTDTTIEGLNTSTENMMNSPFDLIEWRADFYNDIEDEKVRLQAMTFLRAQFANTPILFTIRTSPEGGNLEITTEDYISLIISVIDSGLMDIVDVELSRGDDTLKTISAAAQKAGVKVIGSLHDNFSTPSKDRIVHHLCQMQQLGADIVKFAVTPESPRDVLTLIDATLVMQETHNDTPIITMAMGRQGAISRVCGSIFGSSVTFGTVGKASAPGQLPAELLSTFLTSLA